MTRAEALRITVDRIYARSEDSPDGCRLWTGPVNHAGYPVVRIPGHSTTGAYRAVYEWANGPIPDGMQVEHACHSANVETCTDGSTCLHRRCVQPAHLELVTRAENNRRGMKKQSTACVNGHEATPENVWHRSDGRRQCRACNRDRQRARGIARGWASV